MRLYNTKTNICTIINDKCDNMIEIHPVSDIIMMKSDSAKHTVVYSNQFMYL